MMSPCMTCCVRACSHVCVDVYVYSHIESACILLVCSPVMSTKVVAIVMSLGKNGTTNLSARFVRLVVCLS